MNKSREDARPKRLALFQALQYGHTSVAALSAAVGGNALLRTWISQALRDGEIVRVDGVLRLPGPVPAGDSDETRAWSAACDAAVSWMRSMNEGEQKDRAREIIQQLDFFYDEVLDELPAKLQDASDLFHNRLSEL